MNINGKIATLILRAQNASDGGKGKDQIRQNRRGNIEAGVETLEVITHNSVYKFEKSLDL